LEAWLEGGVPRDRCGSPGHPFWRLTWRSFPSAATTALTCRRKLRRYVNYNVCRPSRSCDQAANNANIPCYFTSRSF
jgi:hypothetical protein